MMGAWGVTKREPDVVTVKDALEQRLKQTGGSLLYAKGTEISGDSEAGFAEAVENAKQADVVVMALGESAEMSGKRDLVLILICRGIKSSCWKKSRQRESLWCCWCFLDGPWCWIGRRSMCPRSWRRGFQERRQEMRLPI